jgi:RNA polymerase sigma-70 factor (sigma-E family)
VRFPQGRRGEDEREEFRQFAAASQGHLRRSAYLLCGDWHFAEDLVQTAFDRMYRHWHRVRAAHSPDAYARQVVYRCFLDSRKRSPNTVPLDHVSENALHGAGSQEPGPETRIAVLQALATLPPRTRAVVVLRYWDDLSIEQTAGILGIAAGSVKSLSSRGLDLLRSRLTEFADSRSGSSAQRHQAQRQQPHQHQEGGKS